MIHPEWAVDKHKCSLCGDGLNRIVAWVKNCTRHLLCLLVRTLECTHPAVRHKRVRMETQSYPERREEAEPCREGLKTDSILGICIQ